MTKRLLIAEDEPHIALSLEFVFQRDGLDVETVEDGSEVVPRTRIFQPDLIILDVMLPGKNGYEICQELQQDPSLARIPAIMLTARAQEAERKKGLQLGAAEYVTKPFKVSDLREKVHSILDNK